MTIATLDPIGGAFTALRTALSRTLDGVSAAADADRPGGARAPVGGTMIDRGRVLRFEWAGRSMTGFAGDSLASALLANGVRVVSRSALARRPRGVTSAGVDETAALVAVGEHGPIGVAATRLELVEGLAARPERAWPGPGLDWSDAVSWAGPGLGAALSPGWAGADALERGPGAAVETVHRFVDVLVVGAGAAGIEAARVLAEAGRDVLLIDQDAVLGGRLTLDDPEIEGKSAQAWLAERVSAFEAAGGVSMTRARAVLLTDGVAEVFERPAPSAAAINVEPARAWRVHAEAVVLATGAIEQGLPFADNDRPGVMRAGAVRGYLNRYGVLAGRRIALATLGDDGYAQIDRLGAAGAEVSVLDLRDRAAARRSAGLPGVAHRAQIAPLRAIGRVDVAGLEIAGWRPEGGLGAPERLECDIVAVAGGWRPAVRLLRTRRGPRDAAPSLCGAAAGLGDPDACAASGRAAAERLLGRDAAAPEADGAADPASAAAAAAMLALARARAPQRVYVNLRTDRDLASAELAARRGVAGDHGRDAAVERVVDRRLRAALDAAADALDDADGDVRKLARAARAARVGLSARAHAQDWILAHGGVLERDGVRRAASHFPRAGESRAAAAAREAEIARARVALGELSERALVRVEGADAAAALARMLTPAPDGLQPGETRDCAWLDARGGVRDLVAVTRLSPSAFLLAGLGEGEALATGLEIAAGEGPALSASARDEGERLAGFALIGPAAAAALALMKLPAPAPGAAAEATLGDAPALILRRDLLRGGAEDAPVDAPEDAPEGVFGDAREDAETAAAQTPTAAFEIYLPSGAADAAADALADAAAAFEGAPIGRAAREILRVEAGGPGAAEIAHRPTLADLGCAAWLGAEALPEPAMRPRLTRFAAATSAGEDGHGVLRAGDLVSDPSARRAGAERATVGWITSVAPARGERPATALGFLKGAAAAWRPGAARGFLPVAHDPDGRDTPVRPIAPSLEPAARAAGDAAALSQAADAVGDRPAPAALARRTALGGALGEMSSKVFGRSAASAGGPEVEREGAPDGAHEDAPAWLAENAPRAVTRLRLFPGADDAARAAASAAAAAAVGAAQALEAGAAADGSGGARLQRLGPDDWRLIDAPAGAAAKLQAALAGRGAVWDDTGAAGRIRVGGPAAAAAVNRLAALDLRAARRAPGRLAAGAICGAPALVDAVAPDVFDLWIARSRARDLWSRLETAARAAAAD